MATIGTLHFIVLMVLNILQLLSLNAPSLFFLDLGDPFLSTLGPVIICRFILNLRYVDAVENSCPSTIRQSASLRFTGDMGQLLSIGEDQENDDDDDGRFIRNGGLDNIAVAIDVIEDSVRVPVSY
ncbi:hypothetical protein BDY19DRAFT_995861 [Irpex rosettiformis]|uniref:Uncharacterized protein n=1 Tax=Irpex rosettiformis TaxID=378272 RepID=A0ACB8TXN6_9APHY|nr:hypothetical protein BDY19DRAFT_995861 [Irpex rosettiformis]